MDTIIKLVGDAGPAYLGWLISLGLIVRIIMMAQQNVSAQDRNTKTLLAVIKDKQESDRELGGIRESIVRISTILDERLPR